MKTFDAAVRDSKFKQIMAWGLPDELNPGPDLSFKFGEKGEYELRLEALLDGSPAIGGKRLYTVALYKNDELMTGEKLPVIANEKGGDK